MKMIRSFMNYYSKHEGSFAQYHQKQKRRIFIRIYVVFNPNQEKNLLGHRVVDYSNHLNNVVYLIPS